MSTSTIAPPPAHPALRILAEIVSVLLHPLFVPVYVLLFTLWESPAVVGIDPVTKGRISLSIGLMYILFPLVTVVLAKLLGFVESIRLRTQKDRIIPYVACGIYYFWMWYVLHRGGFPAPMAQFALAVFLASSGGLVLNAWLKVSMHTLAAGTALAYLFVLALGSPFSYGIYLSAGALLAGLSGTARLLSGDHTPFEVWIGFGIGVLAMLLAVLFS